MSLQNSPSHEARVGGQHRALLTPKQAGDYLGGISASTLAKWRVYGTGPAYIRIGNKILYQPTDLDSFLADRRRFSTSQGGAE